MSDLVSLSHFRRAIAEATSAQRLAEIEAEARKIGAITPTQKGPTGLQLQILQKRQELANG